MAAEERSPGAIVLLRESTCSPSHKSPLQPSFPLPCWIWRLSIRFSVETEPDLLSPFMVVPDEPRRYLAKIPPKQGRSHRAASRQGPASPHAGVLGCGDTGREDSLPGLWLPCHHHPHPHHCEMSITEWPQGHSTMLSLPQRDPTDQLADSYLPTHPRTRKECWGQTLGPDLKSLRIAHGREKAII